MSGISLTLNFSFSYAVSLISIDTVFTTSFTYWEVVLSRLISSSIFDKIELDTDTNVCPAILKIHYIICLQTNISSIKVFHYYSRYPLDKVTAKQLFWNCYNLLKNKLQMFEVSSMIIWKNKYISTDFKVV